MNRIDELLNKYIDGELLEGELEEVQSLLKIGDNVKKLKALQVVDNSLKTLETDTAPSGFTTKFMKVLSANSSKIKLSKNYFTGTINAIFIVFILAIIIFAFSLINWNFSTASIDTQVNSTMKSVTDNIPSFLSFFKNKNVMFFGSFLSLILLLAAYYSIEAHKSFKKRLDNLTNR
jgi:hypothetical protein